MPSSRVKFIFAQFFQRESERISECRCFYQIDTCMLALHGAQPLCDHFKGLSGDPHGRGKVLNRETVYHLICNVPRKQVYLVPV